MSVWRRVPLLQRFFVFMLNLAPRSWSGATGIRFLGHRNYVGGSGVWEQMGKLQIDFLVQQGLKPSQCLLDIGCGCLRAGRYFLDYLEPGNYLGLDKEQELVTLGLTRELKPGVAEAKKPEFVISSSFEFERFSKKPQVSIAQSIFTHFAPADIVGCLKKLRAFVDVGHVLYATFFEGAANSNHKESHDIWAFCYPRAQMEHFGQETGWKAHYIGDWNQPRNQMMMRYEAI